MTRSAVREWTACLALATAVVACDSTTTIIAPSRVVPLAGDSVFIGSTLGIVLISTYDGSVVTSAPDYWASTNTTVAEVSPGRVYGFGVGSASIEVIHDGFQTSIPVRVVPLWLSSNGEFVETSSSDGTHCALRSTGGVACRSTSVADSVRSYEAVASGSPALVSLSVSASHQCGLNAQGFMYCRGRNANGQLGTGRTGASSESFVAAVPGVRFSAVAIAANGTAGHSCGIRAADSVVVCFGNAAFGQTGHGLGDFDSIPSPVVGDLRALSIVAGPTTTCAIGVDHEAFCWGGSSRGVVETPGGSLTPRRAPDGHQFKALSLSSHICGITMDDLLYCWGTNTNGQIGTGSGSADNISHPTPIPVPLFSVPARVYAAGQYTCVIDVSDALSCWGAFPPQGRFGTWVGTRRSLPMHLARGLTFRSISTSADNICGVTTDGRLTCF